MNKTLYILLVVVFYAKSFSQNEEKPFKLNYYTELYYSKSVNTNANENPNFIYNYKKLNQVNLNLAYIKAAYNKTNFRANIALMLGNYAQYNLSNEANWAKNIFEANFGLKLSQRHNIWLDAGIMPSHLGFETAVGMDNLTLTRSMLAENSPYYETGAKLSFINPKENVSISILYLNGWQHIKRPNYVNRPSFGSQIAYRINPKLSINYSNFLGSDKADSLKATRTYHNIYSNYSPNPKWDFIFGYDIGSDKNAENTYSVWYSPVLIGRYHLNAKHKIAARAEYYYDPKQLIITTFTQNGFQTFGFSFNYDYLPSSKISLRSEIKKYNSKDSIFQENSEFSSGNIILTIALCIKL